MKNEINMSEKFDTVVLEPSYFLFLEKRGEFSKNVPALDKVGGPAFIDLKMSVV